jgi:hypothetical protein
LAFIHTHNDSLRAEVSVVIPENINSLA